MKSKENWRQAIRRIKNSPIKVMKFMKNARKHIEITREDGRLAFSLESVLKIDCAGKSACFLLEDFSFRRRFYCVDAFYHSAWRACGWMKKIKAVSNLRR